MGGTNADDEPPAYGSPISNATTPAQKSAAAPSDSVSTFDDRPAYVKSLDNAKGSAFNPAMQQDNSTSQPAAIANRASNAASGAAQSVASAVPTTSEELKDQLAKANAQISRLTAQAAESSGLRQRKGDSVTESTRGTSGPQTGVGLQQAPGGVPVPLVAVLCFISFILAYLLF